MINGHSLSSPFCLCLLFELLYALKQYVQPLVACLHACITRRFVLSHTAHPAVDDNIYLNLITVC